MPLRRLSAKRSPCKREEWLHNALQTRTDARACAAHSGFDGTHPVLHWPPGLRLRCLHETCRRIFLLSRIISVQVRVWQEYEAGTLGELYTIASEHKLHLRLVRHDLAHVLSPCCSHLQACHIVYQVCRMALSKA